MAPRRFADPLVAGLALAFVAQAPQGALAADLPAQELPVACRTVFIGMPVPPYIRRHGCIDNVITVHELPEHRHPFVVLKQRDVQIESHSVLIVKVR